MDTPLFIIAFPLSLSLPLHQSIQIKLVLGHSAQWRKKPTVEGYTHDWTILVRGEDGQNISHFVEKVVFFLHESFPKPKRGELCVGMLLLLRPVCIVNYCICLPHNLNTMQQ